MLRGYRRRFVAINMALIALVLALALGMQVAYVYRSEYADLQKTMGLILEPWRGAGEGFRPQAAPPAGEETPKPPPGRDRNPASQPQGEASPLRRGSARRRYSFPLARQEARNGPVRRKTAQPCDLRLLTHLGQ